MVVGCRGRHRARFVRRISFSITHFGLVAYCGHDRTTQIGKSARRLGHDVTERAGYFAYALALRDDVLLEFLNIAQQEISAGQQRIDLTLDLDALDLGRTTRIGLGFVEQAVEHALRTVDHDLCLDLGLHCYLICLKRGITNCGVCGTLREQEGTTDALGSLFVAGPRRICLRLGGNFLKSRCRCSGSRLHRRSMLLHCFERGCNLRQVRLHFIGVAPLLHDFERGTRDGFGAQFHGQMLRISKAGVRHIGQSSYPGLPRGSGFNKYTPLATFSMLPLSP